MLVSREGHPLSARERGIVHEAVATFYESGTRRRLREFAPLLRGSEVSTETGESLGERFEAWIEQRAWVFDCEEAEDLWAGPYLGIDLTQILGDPIVREVIVAYVFHRVDSWFDGYPTAMVWEEAWRYVDDPLCAPKAKELLKTVRRRSGIIGFCSQSAQDALGSAIADSIIEQSPTQIWLPNPKAPAEACCGAWGLTQEELQWVRELPETSRCFLLKQGRETAVVRLDLSGMEDTLLVLSSREHNVRRLDDIRSEVGDDPSAWLPRLCAVGEGAGNHA
jgi:type IV secretion system protein VirB4